MSVESDELMLSHGWKHVVYAHDCTLCDMCEEPVCPHCEDHYADCACPGPHQDDIYEYKDMDGVEYARLLEE
jgi:hypothetical protein